MGRTSKVLRRSGELIVENSSRRLPRAQERVRQALLGRPVEEALHLFGRPSRAVYPRVVRGLSVSHKALYRSNRARRPLPKRAKHVDPFLGFNSLVIRVPTRVKFCLRRKFRREVLFARDVAGHRGIGRGKRWIRSENSNYRC